MVLHMRVRLYINLKIKTQRAWSLMAMEGPRKGKVIGIFDGAVMRDVTFPVSESGRQRVIREGSKNVHAFVDGTLIEKFPLRSMAAGVTGSRIAPGANVRVTYDPYTMPHMIRTDCVEFVHAASLVAITPAGVFAKLPKCGAKRAHPLGALLQTNDDWNG